MGSPSPRVRPRRARPRYPAGMVVAAVATVLVVLASFGVIGLRLLATDPEPPDASTEVVAAPEPGPGEWELPDLRWEPLPLPDPSSPLYGTQVNALSAQPPVALTGCAPPRTAGTVEEWEAAVRDQWRCVHTSWAPTLQRLGWSTTMPEVRIFSGEGDDSSCGYLEAPAFYCSAGSGSVHFGTRHYDMARNWDLSVNEMVNHEYGHHLQYLSGITAAKLRLPYTPEIERRAELQATCWSAAMTRANTSFRFGQDEYTSWQERLKAMRADEVHGSRESLMHWGTRGLYAATMNDCNTWVVPAANVS